MVMAIIGLVLGIISILGVLVPFLDLILGAGGLVLGIISRRQGSRGLGLAALIVGIIGTAIGAIYTILWIIGTIAANHG
jgi:hypothetical protein